MLEGRYLSFGEGWIGSNRSASQALADALSRPFIADEERQKFSGILIHIKPCSEITVGDLNAMVTHLEQTYSHSLCNFLGFSSAKPRTRQSGK